MKASQMIDRRFVVEARAYMARHGLPPESFDSVRASIAQRSYLAEIEPFVEQIASITSMGMPSYTLHADGKLEMNGDGLTDSMRKLVESYQKIIDEVRARYDRMF